MEANPNESYFYATNPYDGIPDSKPPTTRGKLRRKTPEEIAAQNRIIESDPERLAMFNRRNRYHMERDKRSDELIKSGKKWNFQQAPEPERKALEQTFFDFDPYMHHVDGEIEYRISRNHPMFGTYPAGSVEAISAYKMKSALHLHQKFINGEFKVAKLIITSEEDVGHVPRVDTHVLIPLGKEVLRPSAVQPMDVERVISTGAACSSMFNIDGGLVEAIERERVKFRAYSDPKYYPLGQIAIEAFLHGTKKLRGEKYEDKNAAGRAGQKLNQIIELTKVDVKGPILDLGAAPGSMAIELAKKGASVTAVVEPGTTLHSDAQSVVDVVVACDLAHPVAAATLVQGIQSEGKILREPLADVAKRKVFLEKNVLPPPKINLEKDGKIPSKYKGVICDGCVQQTQDKIVTQAVWESENARLAWSQFFVAAQVVEPGGFVVVKLQGSMTQASQGLIYVMSRCGPAAIVKPVHSRVVNSEIYVVVTNFNPQGIHFTVLSKMLVGSPVTSVGELCTGKRGCSIDLSWNFSDRLLGISPIVWDRINMSTHYLLKRQLFGMVVYNQMMAGAIGVPRHERVEYMHKIFDGFLGRIH